MKDVMRKLTSTTTEHVLLESTRAFIEKFTSEMVAEDMRNPEIRAWLFDDVRRDYKKSKRKIGFPGKKRKRRAKS
jgi:hypothetical protein